MSLWKSAFLAIATVLICIPQFALAGSHEHQNNMAKQETELSQHMKSLTTEGIQLSDDLLTLLNKEMLLIQEGMMNLVPAIAAGEWDNVSTIGQKIKASFILKQKLTETQKEELNHVLPQQFIEMDMDFHKSAGMLAHAADKKNADVVNFYFYKMNASCVSCHGKYAAGRFPGLANGDDKEHHH